MYFRNLRPLRLLFMAFPLLALFWWIGGLATQAQEEVPNAAIHLAAIAPVLEEQLAESSEPVSFLVVLAEQPDPEGYLSRQGLRAANRTVKAEALYRYLSGFARSRQAPLRAWLDKQGITYRAFYIINAIEVQGDASLALALRARADVGRLAANPAVMLSQVDASQVDVLSPANPDTANPPLDPPYGIRQANAPVAWGMGYTGQGIVVASQDTGVDWTHPALHDQYRGWITATQTVTHPYNWYDYWGTANRGNCDPDPQVPCDDNSHGTHTVGTMLGTNSTDNQIIGMAPDAQWIGCRNMNGGNGTPASYIACFEFFFAPFPQGGDPKTDGVSAKAPHIINNSWYCPPSEGCDLESLHQVIKTVRDAGQLIVVSGGNEGPGCSSAKFPITIYPEVFSVGAHNGAGNITGFSSRGPVTVDGSGRLKPQITAAGDTVLSSIPGGSYGNKSGTSMAAPHMAGAAALLWSAAPHLIGQLDETEQIFLKSATPVLHNGCGEGPEPVSPNNTYGYGRLDVAAALGLALHPGVITTTVKTVLGPSAGISVTLTDSRTNGQQVGLTDAAGKVTFQRVYSGTYEITATGNWAGGGMDVALVADEAKSVEIELPAIYYFPLIQTGSEAGEGF